MLKHCRAPRSAVSFCNLVRFVLLLIFLNCLSCGQEDRLPSFFPEAVGPHFYVRSIPKQRTWIIDKVADTAPVGDRYFFLPWHFFNYIICIYFFNYFFSEGKDEIVCIKTRIICVSTLEGRSKSIQKGPQKIASWKNLDETNEPNLYFTSTALL